MFLFILRPYCCYDFLKENAVLANEINGKTTNPKDAADGTIRKNLEFL